MEKSTRRRLLAAGFSGTAIGLLGNRAGAAPPDSTTPTDDEGSTPSDAAEGEQDAVAPTTEPPQRPTDDDIPLLQFAESFELAARDLYATALESGIDDDTVGVMRANHQAYASVLRGLLGVAGGASPARVVYDRFASGFSSGDMAEFAATAYELESVAVATHTELLGELVGIHGAAMIASILVVEARQATVLADIGGIADDLGALFVSDAEALTPSATSGG